MHGPLVNLTHVLHVLNKKLQRREAGGSRALLMHRLQEVGVCDPCVDSGLVQSRPGPLSGVFSRASWSTSSTHECMTGERTPSSQIQPTVSARWHQRALSSSGHLSAFCIPWDSFRNSSKLRSTHCWKEHRHPKLRPCFGPARHDSGVCGGVGQQ